MIKSLTSLRGIFILFIFFHHCMNLYPGGGSMAVTFFFVLGGFSMTIGYKDRLLRPEFSYRQYITRRNIKFYPLHWLCLLLALPMSWASFKVPTFFLNALLLQTWVPVRSVYFSFNQVSWYLADTMFFAVMFPLLCKWIVKASARGRILISISFVCFYIIIAILLPPEMYHAVLYISPYMRLVDFVLGIYLALGYMRMKEASVKVGMSNAVSLLVILGIVILLVTESYVFEGARSFSVIYWPLVAVLILFASLNGGGLENKYLLRLGELSFIIFMIHQLVISYSTFIFGKILHLDNTFIFVSFTLVITIVLSVVVERVFSKPVTQWLTKKIQPSLTARS